jgi:hypothetical protein
MYLIEPRHPWLYLVACLAGAALCLLKVAFVAPLGIFLVFFANGSIYATTTRHIDTNVDKQYNLIALSVWLFIGDIGSVAGSNTLPYVRARVAHSSGVCVLCSILSCVAYFASSFFSLCSEPRRRFATSFARARPCMFASSTEIVVSAGGRHDASALWLFSPSRQVGGVASCAHWRAKLN